MRWVKKIYNWTLSWADSKYSVWALFLLAFSESSFFPIPPDVLLIALCLGRPKKSFYYAFICSLGSVLGGMFGYLIGYKFYDLATPILDFYGLNNKVDMVSELYQQYAGWAVGIAGFTPIPYKVFTITAGFCKIDFLVFCFASVVSRSARFFIVATLIKIFGEKIRTFIDKYFNILTIVFSILLIGGFVLIKYFLK
ncbi:MAG: DedA family protein [Candidatus Aureabacteria bacterium]|nr:DedA family protein [Candidatus Auribacterota bacterium]